MTSTCVVCQAPFEPNKYTATRQRYCSRRCWDKARHERERDQRIARMRTYHLANREKALQDRRDYRARDPERWRAYDKARYTGERREIKLKESAVQHRRSQLEKPWAKLIRSALKRSQAKRVPFALTPEWGEATWTGKCALTGLDFVLGQKGSGPKAFSPSIDRIKPELGYVPENCRFVLWAINAFKAEGDDATMFHLASTLLSFRTTT